MNYTEKQALIRAGNIIQRLARHAASLDDEARFNKLVNEIDRMVTLD